MNYEMFFWIQYSLGIVICYMFMDILNELSNVRNNTRKKTMFVGMSIICFFWWFIAVYFLIQVNKDAARQRR